jgi:hypothetical protein
LVCPGCCKRNQLRLFECSVLGGVGDRVAVGPERWSNPQGWARRELGSSATAVERHAAPPFPRRLFL